jgi:hypothetical protein
VLSDDHELKLVDEFFFRLANSHNAKQHGSPNDRVPLWVADLFVTNAETFLCESNSFANIADQAGQFRAAVEWLFDVVYLRNYTVCAPKNRLSLNASSTLA